MSAIERYLEELARRLEVEPARREAIIAESADHLRASVEALIMHGTPAADAERGAIARFGSPAEVAAAFRPLPLGAGAVALRASLAFVLVPVWRSRPPGSAA